MNNPKTENSYPKFQKVKTISRRYRFLNKKPNFEQLCMGSGLIAARRKEFINVVDKTISSLDYFHQKFILNDFFMDNPGEDCWWKSIYSRSTYYRYRRESVDYFLKNFYEFYRQVYGFNYYDPIGN